MKQTLQDLTVLFNKQDYVTHILKQYRDNSNQLTTHENLLCECLEKIINERHEDLIALNYVCPITHELLLDPTIIVHEDDSISSQYDQYFEYQNTLKWIQRNKTNPLTRQSVLGTIRDEHKQREIIKTLSDYTSEYIQKLSEDEKETFKSLTSKIKADLLLKANLSIVKAIIGGNLNLVKQYLEIGADINAKDNYGDTLAYTATFYDKKEILELLLSKGADINAKDNYGNTLAYTAVSYDKKEILELLLDKGADINAKDKYGNTLAHIAVSNGNKEIVELLNKGIDVQSSYINTFLSIFTIEGLTNTMRRFI